MWDPCARPTASLCAPPRPSSHPPLLSPPSLQLEHQLRQGALNMQALAFHGQVRGGGERLSQRADLYWLLQISLVICM